MKLSQAHIDDFCHLMFKAFLEIRLLGWDGEAAQAADLADAFHNLPILLRSDDFDWDVQRMFFESYCTKYQGAARRFDYASMLDQIRVGTYARGG